MPFEVPVLLVAIAMLVSSQFNGDGARSIASVGRRERLLEGFAVRIHAHFLLRTDRSYRGAMIWRHMMDVNSPHSLLAESVLSTQQEDSVQWRSSNSVTPSGPEISLEVLDQSPL